MSDIERIQSSDEDQKEPHVQYMKCYQQYTAIQQLFSSDSKSYQHSDRDVPRINWDKIVKLSTQKNASIKNTMILDPIHNNNNPVFEHEYKSVSDSESDVYDEQSTSLPVAAHQQHQSSEQLENDFWRIIAEIRCRDRDEGRMSKRNVNMTVARKNIVMSMLTRKFMPELYDAIREIVPYDAESPECKNFLTHIIAKGKDFYEGIKKNPIVSVYLCDNHYPIYTWLTS